MLKIGLIGLGQHGLNAVLPSILSNNNWKLTAVADNSQDRLAQVNVEGIQRFTSAQDLFEKADVDAVYIATLLETHHPLTIAALQAGKHVICEKPMAENAQQCREMLAAADKAGRILAVNFETRFQNHFMTMRQWVREGFIGDLQAIHIQHLWDCHKSFGALAERRHRLIDRSGGLDCGIHKLDMARYVSGGKEWTRIEALGVWLGESVTYPPHISILGQLDHRMTATLNASLGYSANIKPRPYYDAMTLVGTQGVISYTVDAPAHNSPLRTQAKVSCYRKEDVIEIPVEFIGHTVEISRLLDELHACIHDPSRLASTILPTATDGLQAQIAVEWSHKKALEYAGR